MRQRRTTGRASRQGLFFLKGMRHVLQGLGEPYGRTIPKVPLHPHESPKSAVQQSGRGRARVVRIQDHIRLYGQDLFQGELRETIALDGRLKAKPGQPLTYETPSSGDPHGGPPQNIQHGPTGAPREGGQALLKASRLGFPLVGPIQKLPDPPDVGRNVVQSAEGKDKDGKGKGTAQGKPRGVHLGIHQEKVCGIEAERRLPSHAHASDFGEEAVAEIADSDQFGPGAQGFDDLREIRGAADDPRRAMGLKRGQQDQRKE